MVGEQKAKCQGRGFKESRLHIRFVFAVGAQHLVDWRKMFLHMEVLLTGCVICV